MELSFRNINIFAQVERETELYRHYQLDEVKDRYDSNFIEFLSTPTLSELKEAMYYLQHKHGQSGRQFLKAVFPQDEDIPLELHQYLLTNQFEIGCLEMYAIEPNCFTCKSIRPEVKIEFVSEKTLEGYLAIHYQDAQQWGEGYAQAKQAMLKRDFEQKRKAQIVALLNGQVIGSVDVIESANTAEIDNLFVLPAYQKQGVGTKMQQFVMKQYVEKTIILVADGDDTPREMYTKQGYTYIGKQLNALKTSLD